MKERLFHKNFTLLVLGQASSLFGNFILRFALSMYILDLTGSAAVFAGMLSAALIPTILLSPFGGILADRINRRNLMVALDTLTAVFVTAPLLWGSGGITAITALLIALSVLGAFETPAVQACVPQMHTGGSLVKANAIIQQISAFAAFAAPILGGLLYAAIGLKPLMLGSAACFLTTALLECFIKLSDPRSDHSGSGKSVLSTVKSDLSESMRFMFKEQKSIYKMLVLAAAVNFLIGGIVLIGLPYIVRVILDLSAGYYGIAQAAIAIAAILGGIAAGVLVGKMRMRKLSLLLGLLGLLLIPVCAVFIIKAGAIPIFTVSVVMFFGMQLAVSIFSIFAVSFIQQKTPVHLMGKIMAYAATLSFCILPLGQIMYGFLFDEFRASVYLVLIPASVVVIMIGLLSAGFFKSLETEQPKNRATP